MKCILVRKNRLFYWRKARGLTQSDLAELIGVTYITISNWERDVTKPTPQQVQKMARLLETSARELFPFEGY